MNEVVSVADMSVIVMLELLHVLFACGLLFHARNSHKVCVALRLDAVRALNLWSVLFRHYRKIDHSRPSGARVQEKSWCSARCAILLPQQRRTSFRSKEKCVCVFSLVWDAEKSAMKVCLNRCTMWKAHQSIVSGTGRAAESDHFLVENVMRAEIRAAETRKVNSRNFECALHAWAENTHLWREGGVEKEGKVLEECVLGRGGSEHGRRRGGEGWECCFFPRGLFGEEGRRRVVGLFFFCFGVFRGWREEGWMGGVERDRYCFVFRFVGVVFFLWLSLS